MLTTRKPLGLGRATCLLAGIVGMGIWLGGCSHEHHDDDRAQTSGYYDDYGHWHDTGDRDQRHYRDWDRY